MFASTKEVLKDGEFLVIGDLAENFSFVVQDEAQSFHWNNAQSQFTNLYIITKRTSNLCKGSHLKLQHA